MVADIRKFERCSPRYLAGEVDEDVFKVFRLANGVYGQRQGGHNQMLRIKAPYGAITPEQLDAARGHLRALQPGLGPPHHPPERAVPLRAAGARARRCCGTSPQVGLTTREACSDTVRNVMGCHLAGACPHEVLDIQPWAEATFWHFLRNPISAASAPQVQDQLLGLRDRLRPGDVQRRRA